MYHIDMTLAEQMGFTKEQVARASQYSQKNKVDIYDALLYLQKRQNQSSQKSNVSPSSKTSPSKNLIEGSILHPFKNINLNNYEIIFSKKASRMNLPGKKVDLRQQFSPVGLLNVYNCCYLNSLLQCYFLSTDFIKYIFQAEPLMSLQSLESKKAQVKVKRIQNEYNLLHTLKQIFTKMCLTSKKYIDPTQVLRNLVDSVGQKIQYGDEKDLFQTNIQIIERLNQCLLYTKKYYKSENQDLSNDKTKDEFLSTNSNGKSIINQSKIKERDNIKRLFYGQKIQYTDSNNNNDTQILSDFLGIIINPAHQNLYKALHQQFHYEVQIDIPEQKRKIKTKKHTYIRQVPEYLYFYINRTGYNAQQKQALKNQEKISFDFVIYLDSFMEKYKAQTTANNDLIIGLWKKKNLLQKKRNSFDIFAKKLQQCRQLASVIQGWKNKLPEQKDIDCEKQTIQKQLSDIEKQLQKIQSRKQKYCLMYIFVHRGDAVSGHYWGYGRNAQSWYKFDINTNKMKEQQILLDLYKCGGTPYSLVYVKEQNLPTITYKYYKDFSITNQNMLLDIQDKNKMLQNSYVSLVPQGLKKVVIAQNIQIHQQFIKRRNLDITSKLIKQYLTRFNCIESQAVQVKKVSQGSFKLLPSYDNFALYLWTKNQLQLAKYSIFYTSLKTVANLSPVQIMQDQVLLTSIQKQFRKKAKKNKSLKHFCIQFQPQEGGKYSQYLNDFLYEKQVFLVLLKLINFIQIIQKYQKQKKVITDQMQNKMNIILKRIAGLMKFGKQNHSYIKAILSEIPAVYIFKIIRANCQIKLNSQELNLLLTENQIKQAKIFGNKQIVLIQSRLMSQQQYEQLKKKHKKGQQLWNVEQIGKGPNRQVLQKRFSSVMQNTKIQVMIFKNLQRLGKFSKVNEITGQIEEYNDQNENKKQQSESLI